MRSAIHPGKRDKIATCFLDLEKGIHELRVRYTSPRGPDGVILRVKKAAGRETLGSSHYLHQR